MLLLRRWLANSQPALLRLYSNKISLGLKEMLDTPAVMPQTTDYADVGRRLKSIFIGSIGNLVEWYDFYAYAAFQIFFAASFFPSGDPVVENLKASTLFAFTFLMRPNWYGMMNILIRYIRA